MKIQPSRMRHLSPEQVATIRAAPNVPGIIKSLAMDVGFSTQAVRSVRRGKSHYPDGGPQIGPNHKAARLTNEQVAAIRAVPFARGVGKKLAITYGVSESVISRVRQGRGYAAAEPQSARLDAAATAAKAAHEAGEDWPAIVLAVVSVYASKAWSKR